MQDLTQKINEYIHSIADNKFKDVTPDKYRFMKYPKLIPMMKFSVSCYEIEDIGHLMIMNTNGMGGAMKLQTLSFTPNTGKDIPYLLIDSMVMKKKALAYVEYYNCTQKNLNIEGLGKVKEKYKNVPDYAEKDAWYIKERTQDSLIKGGENADENLLYDMVRESIDAYLAAAKEAPADKENLIGLKAFQNRMLKEGNPSEGTMVKVLGKEGYEEFYTTCIMPVL